MAIRVGRAVLTQYAVAAEERTILCGEHHMICRVTRRVHNAQLGSIDGKFLAIRQRLYLDSIGYLGTDIRGIGALELVNLAIWIEANFNGERQTHREMEIMQDFEDDITQRPRTPQNPQHVMAQSTLTLVGQRGAHNIFDTADMIVMPVRQNDGANGGLFLFKHTVQMFDILWHILVPGVD